MEESKKEYVQLWPDAQYMSTDEKKQHLRSMPKWFTEEDPVNYDGTSYQMALAVNKYSKYALTMHSAIRSYGCNDDSDYVQTLLKVLDYYKETNRTLFSQLKSLNLGYRIILNSATHDIYQMRINDSSYQLTLVKMNL